MVADGRVMDYSNGMEGRGKKGGRKEGWKEGGGRKLQEEMRMSGRGRKGGIRGRNERRGLRIDGQGGEEEKEGGLIHKDIENV